MNFHYIMENNFKNTNDWIQKTHENWRNEQEYNTKLNNNEDTSMFNINKKPRSQTTLLPIHSIPQYDATLYRFIIETTQTISKLNERILELEKKC